MSRVRFDRELRIAVGTPRYFLNPSASVASSGLLALYQSHLRVTLIRIVRGEEDALQDDGGNGLDRGRSREQMRFALRVPPQTFVAVKL